jgi:hypothetical protein
VQYEFADMVRVLDLVGYVGVLFEGEDGGVAGPFSLSAARQ